MKYKIIFLIISIFLLGCAKDKNETIDDIQRPSTSDRIEAVHNLNVSFLLDLSDRIDPNKYPNSTMEYYQRDVENIKSVSNAFLSYIRHKKVVLLNDQIQVYFNPEPSNAEINQMSSSLKVQLDRNITRNRINEVENLYDSIPIKFYELAIEDNEFVGSDIWRFFKDKVNNYAIKDDYRNILVILTDGYIYHQNTRLEEDNQLSYITPQKVRQLNLVNSDWENQMENKKIGFIPANQSLEDLEVLVIGLNPSDINPYEKDVLIKFWSDWLMAMGVKKFKLLDSDLPSNQKSIIEKFIFNK